MKFLVVVGPFPAKVPALVLRCSSAAPARVRREAPISKYRRVLEHFDAVIFGDPIYKYSYREAVIDGYLIDHEPPVQITTALSQAGIKFKKGEKIELIDTTTGKIDLAHAPDEIKFEVDEFNKAVVTVPFNKVVAENLQSTLIPPWTARP